MSQAISFCSRCGAQQDHATPFCNRCGHAKSPTPNVHAGYHSSSNETNNIIAIVLAVCGLFMCGPLTSVPGAIMAWLSISKAKTEGRSPSGLATAALWCNVGVTAISLLGCMVMGVLPMLAAGM